MVVIADMKDSPSIGRDKADEEDITVVSCDSDDETEQPEKEKPKNSEKPQLPRFSVTNILSPFNNLDMKDSPSIGRDKADEEDITVVSCDSDDETEQPEKEKPKNSEKPQLPRFSVTNILSPLNNLGEDQILIFC
ncbi:unnamed protein product [Strongylus vulgaris]|uniref:Uncharacterized protein n=1 Tax=Strongylus vulgaris TaxID=40348 RepID=A0A3P7IZ96_STRVU|nr:unnamed protein product [Strongylus vulgaris]